MNVIRLPRLAALFETKTGAKRKRARPRSALIFYTMMNEEQEDGSKRRVAYVAHAGGRGGRYPGHPYRWGSTGAHTLHSEDPLHLEPSIGWQECCGRHGYIRDGVWTPTGDSLEPRS